VPGTISATPFNWPCMTVLLHLTAAQSGPLFGNSRKKPLHFSGTLFRVWER
jgi:hypothetical protein